MSPFPIDLIGLHFLPPCPHTLSLQGRGPSHHSSFKILRLHIRSFLYLKWLGNSLELGLRHHGLLKAVRSSSFPALSSHYSLSHNTWTCLNCKLEKDWGISNTYFMPLTWQGLSKYSDEWMNEWMGSIYIWLLLILMTLRMLGVAKEDPKNLIFFGILGRNQIWFRAKGLRPTKLSSTVGNTIGYPKDLVRGYCISEENVSNSLT